MEKFMSINDAINGFVWGPVMLVLLIGCGVYLSIRMGFIQFTRFGFAMKNTIGKIFKKQDAAEGEVTPFQAVSTALASMPARLIASLMTIAPISGAGVFFRLPPMEPTAVRQQLTT